MFAFKISGLEKEERKRKRERKVCLQVATNKQTNGKIYMRISPNRQQSSSLCFALCQLDDEQQFVKTNSLLKLAFHLTARLN